jgi:hypothetical protein
MVFEVLDMIKGGARDKRNLKRQRNGSWPDGGILSRTGRRKQEMTFGWKGAMSGQKEREAGLTGGIVRRTGRRKLKPAFGWKGKLT